METSNDKKIAGEEEEEEAGKMKWKDSLKIRRGKFKKLSLDHESGDEGQQSWQGDEVDNRHEFQVAESENIYEYFYGFALKY